MRDTSLVGSTRPDTEVGDIGDMLGDVRLGRFWVYASTNWHGGLGEHCSRARRAWVLGSAMSRRYRPSGTSGTLANSGLPSADSGLRQRTLGWVGWLCLSQRTLGAASANS